MGESVGYFITSAVRIFYCFKIISKADGVDLLQSEQLIDQVVLADASKGRPN